MDMRIETVVLPVSDTDRAKSFYGSLGWSLDLDFSAQGSRVIRMSPPGSGCSIVFGVGVTSAEPGSAHGLVLGVADIEAARADLRARGADIGEIFHIEAGSLVHIANQGSRVPGLDPLRRSHASFASFADPDGNGWVLEESTPPPPERC